MQTQLADFIKHTATGQEAAEILASCVHCGFCNATCPTYQILGDELDGPRGRIYLIKNLLEGETASPAMQQHLDRCLSCRSCETTCPSGVKYHRLLDIGRQIIASRLKRPWTQQLLRNILLISLPYPQRFRRLLNLAYRLRPWLPKPLKAKLPKQSVTPAWPDSQHPRQVLLLQGCVQASLAPRINYATATVLDKLGIRCISISNCCGALHYHLDQQDQGLNRIRQLIDACWPQIENGIEAIISTASGCGIQLKEYAELLADDPDYAAKASRFSALSKDICEIIAEQDLSVFKPKPARIALHHPCTLQHGQQLDSTVAALLTQLGFTLTNVADAHLCCGSAGTYSILQPEISKQLQTAKVAALQADQPELIATANIGCWLQIQETAKVPVLHWIELLL